MAQTSQPWQMTLLGDAGPYSAFAWQEMYMYMFAAFMPDANGFVFPNSGSGDVSPLRVRQTAAPSTSIRVAPGSAMLRGIYYRNTTEEVIPIPNNLSGNPRIDRIVLRADYTSQIVRLVHLQGTPAPSPVAPDLTQVDGSIWDLPLATIQVPNGFLTITDANIANIEYRQHTDILTPPGTIVAYAGATAPEGWLLCAGQAVSRTVYARLFATIGTAYGAGDGATTFTLPDLRGRFPLGRDNMSGISANRVTATQADNLGQGAGAESHTLTIAEMPSHAHAFGSGGTGPGVFGETASGRNSSTGEFTTRFAGGGDSHNNMPPYQTVNYIIKY